MIPQARAHIKAQAKQTERLEPPFRQHPVYGRVFAPWGVFGKMYAVPTEAQQKKVGALNSSLQLVLCVGLNVFLIIFAMMGKIFHIDLGYGIVTVIFLFPFAYVYVKSAGAKHLSVVQSRLPLWLALRQYAVEQDRRTMWFFSIFFSACSWGAWTLAHDIQGGLADFLRIFACLFALLAITHSLLIVLRESIASRRE